MIDFLLYTIYGMLGVTILLTVISAVRGVVRRKGETKSNGIRVRLLAWGIGLATAVVLLLTFLLADTTPLVINGKSFDDGLWLRISDMLINSSIILMLVAALGVAFGLSGWSRKIGRK